MKFPKKLLVVFILLLTAFTIVACKPEEEEPVDAKPTFSGTTAVAIVLFDEFDPLDGVTAADEEDGDLTADIVVKTNNVDNTEVGNYTVVYEVEDSAGNVATATRSVTVNDRALEDYPLANYLSGVDLSRLKAEDKDILFAAAERYLLENAYGGIPLYYGASRVLYSDRVQLYTEQYNGVMGFGTGFSQFTEDDSNVLMTGNQTGNAGEYTWRASFTTDPKSLNPWKSDDSSTSDFNDLYHGALYNFFFDSTKTSFEILPELAETLPVPVNPIEINGKTYAKVWQIELKDDLEWTFHPSFDTSVLADGFEDLDASDYLWTWKYALDNNWFRARTGGGDFVSQGIKNASLYLKGSASWEDVGLRLAEGKDNTIELEYITEKSSFDVLYGFSGGVLSPLNQELFEYLGDPDNMDADLDNDANTFYGKDPVSVASSGVYYFETWTPGQLLVFKKNDVHPQSELYHYTGRQYVYIENSAIAFEEFKAGRLESASIPAAELDNYASDPRVKIAPDATTWRLQINAFGTEANRDDYIEANPGVGLSETYVPEPILMYKEMRQSLMYGFDRYEAAVNVVGTYYPAFTLFTEAYFLDGDSKLGVREGEAGSQLVQDFGGSSYGYFPDVALDLFKEAVAQGIADGYYTAGTASNYTVIDLSLTYSSSGNTNAQAMIANIKEQYEELLVDDENFVKVTISVSDVTFPDNYYDYMMVGATDLGIGGISGSLLDAPSFLDVFSDDNRGGFTLNWGIDTTTPLIPVSYYNIDGELVYERWGYNALVEALVGKTYVKDGVEQSSWTDPEDLIDAYLDMNGEFLDELTTEGATVFAEAILGDTLANVAADEGFDSIVAYIVTNTDLVTNLYVLSEVDGSYELYGTYGLATTPEAGIQQYINANYGAYGLIEAVLLGTDAEVAANAYISATYGFTTIDEVATHVGAPVQYVEVYATNFGWDDAVVVLHIGDFYVGYYWL
jgi:ABC-type oligopeptide transport system substrate-binding subunit